MTAQPGRTHPAAPDSDLRMRSVITVRPAPDREPPFDDELPATRLHAVGPWDQPLPFEAGWLDPGRFGTSPPRPGPTRDRPGADRDGHAPIRRGPNGSELRPPSMTAQQWGRRFLVAVLECAAGRRSLSQLSRHAALPVVEGLRNDAAAWGRIAPDRRPGVVRTVRACEPSESSAELSAVVQVGARYRAVAARLERTADGWRCTQLQIG